MSEVKGNNKNNEKLQDKDLENVAGGRSTVTNQDNSTTQTATDTDNTINVSGNWG